VGGQIVKRPVIFCDFDGTITETDNIVAIVEHFDPPGWRDIVGRIVSGETSIREGVGRLFALFPSSRKEDITRFVLERAKIRPGFAELLQFCRERGVEFLVTSGGIDFFVYPLLAPFGIPRERIFCNGSDFSGERVRILWPHRCDAECDVDCGMCKTTIIRRYPAEQYTRILIGDSVTDFAAARLADRIFARSHLQKKCEELELPYVPYDTFYDVIGTLEKELASP